MVNPKYKNYLIILLGLTTIAGGAFAWSQYQELIRLRADSLSDSARADLQKRHFLMPLPWYLCSGGVMRLLFFFFSFSAMQNLL